MYKLHNKIKYKIHMNKMQENNVKNKLYLQFEQTINHFYKQIVYHKKLI
jgi:hypothetical protein